MYEDEFFGFIALGTKWVEGCYCLPNAALKGALESLTKNYKYGVIDSPADLEHLNRRITSRIDDIFDITDPSKKSFLHIERTHRIAKEVKIEFKISTPLALQSFREINLETLSFKYPGKIAREETLEDYVPSGEYLLKLQDSPAYASVRYVMERAGCAKQHQSLTHT